MFYMHMPGWGEGQG